MMGGLGKDWLRWVFWMEQPFRSAWLVVVYMLCDCYVYGTCLIAFPRMQDVSS
jgi:hypothetical protein